MIWSKLVNILLCNIISVYSKSLTNLLRPLTDIYSLPLCGTCAALLWTLDQIRQGLRNFLKRPRFQSRLGKYMACYNSNLVHVSFLEGGIFLFFEEKYQNIYLFESCADSEWGWWNTLYTTFGRNGSCKSPYPCKKLPSSIIETKHRSNHQDLSIAYCWWLKSCTTWDVWNPINNGINYQPQLVQDFSGSKPEVDQQLVD